MENIKKSASQLIGNTPLLELCNYEKKQDLPAHVIAKLEYFNPAGSAKDRVGLRMIERAEQEGKLKPGATIIEPTSGNTGIGIASVAAAKGYHAILTMPETMSVERQKLLRAYGAEVVLTDGKKGMQGSIEKAEELKRTIPGSVIMGQFDNEANPEAHEAATGPEIYRDTDGRVDIFVATVGTGGTLTGTGRYLKKQNPAIQIVAVEPAESPLLSGGQAGAHGIQGIGANFIPSILDRDIYDEIICVTTEDAYKTGNDIAKCEGILVGISSGAAVWAAAQLARRPENKGKNIVALLPDTGDHYLSTTMYD
ncbi:MULTISPECIES: cysteine synthase A [Blautia]|uniref:cysteine synthase A n=1 Tax=Blautia TaxID=572511 RepID=UPI000BA43C3F|nr:MULTISPECIES: cysteine synthase A [Blautia]